jgi:transcriptional regulator with GAF, ATPase, and Fis domain
VLGGPNMDVRLSTLQAVVILCLMLQDEHEASPDNEFRLEAMSGPRQGESFALAEEEIFIGRDPGNQISVLDATASRRHCSVRKEGQVFWLRDLESRNSTFVNGVPTTERLLRHGDQIRVGQSLFVFREPGGTSAEEAVVLNDDAPPGSTIILKKEDTLYLRLPAKGSALPPTARTVHDLNVLLDFSRNVNAVRDLGSLQKRVLDVILEVAPADQAAIFLVTPGSQELSFVLGWDRTQGQTRQVQVSRTILDRVVRDRAAVLSGDVPADEQLQGSDSLMVRRIRSVMAVPLEAQDRLLGVIYLDAATAGARFDTPLLQLVTALGNVAALAIRNVQELEWLGSENTRLREEASIQHSMVGESDAIRSVYNFIARVAGNESTVLIEGESGTGKELVARAIHNNSSRASKPFVAINCAAITETLLESELFGHEKGSFTGALAQKRGKLEVAEGGTVFLDEIGELALPLQAKLLRVLQEREFERVGGTRPIKLDVRLVAATNRDLKKEAEENRFRKDLYYRLNVVSVRMPPLRERKKDIPLLASFFATRCADKVKRRIVGISPEARQCLISYDWPGNVRELENAIERAVALGSTDMILPEDLPDDIVEQASTNTGSVNVLQDGLRDAKKAMIERAIEQADGVYTDAAKILGVHPNHLFRLVRTLKLQPKRKRA